MANQLIDNNGVFCFVDDNGVSAFVDDVGNFLSCTPPPPTQTLMGQAIFDIAVLGLPAFSVFLSLLSG
jgi:hypothetical protein